MTTPILPPHPEPEPPAPQTPAAPKRAWWIKLLLGCAAVFGTFAVLLALLLWYALVVASPHIPSLEALTNYQPDVPMRIYTADHVLIGEYGAQRRDVAHLQDVPVALRQAVIAIEDARYYDHGGVDMMGVIRAAYVALTNGHASQGASTITMQVARNFFLSSEKTYTRKIYEMLLAYKIERALTKDQILEIYMNQIYLGERAYGFASAAHIYFDKDLKDLSLAECAMLAGLPKAPSAYNPVVNPKRAKVRQEYILERMFELGDITRDQYEAAVKQPIILKSPSHTYAVHAEYVAEMVRQMMLAQYKDSAYTRGLVVTTTIRSADQTLAYDALRRGITQYDTRHGYRGPEGHIKLPDAPEERGDAIAQALANTM